MDNQLPTPNTPGPAERPLQANPNLIMPTKAAEALPAAPGEARVVMPSADAASAAVTPLQAAPIMPAAGTPAAPIMPAAAGTIPGTPAVAGDVDVIEPEWVDKAEGVIAAHQGDPYGEEEAIEKLQEDYLQKRYNINVADPNSGVTKPEGS
jgi:hypothetical protein